MATAILRWLGDAGIDTALIDPGKPWQNATDESFNGKFRDEFLSLQWFRNRMDAKVGIEQWRQHYNEVRPHSSLGYLTPAEFTAQLRAGSDDGGRSPAMPLALTRKNTETHDELQLALFSSNHWSEESRQVTPWRQTSPTAVSDSAWRNPYATCSSENFERFIGPILSVLGTPKSATVLQF